VSFQDTLDFVFFGADSMRLLPMNLSPSNRAISELDARNSLALPPASWPVNLVKSAPFADALPHSDRLDIGDRADNLEVHGW
jgi:hypothetical protein